MTNFAKTFGGVLICLALGFIAGMKYEQLSDAALPIQSDTTSQIIQTPQPTKEITQPARPRQIVKFIPDTSKDFMVREYIHIRESIRRNYGIEITQVADMLDSLTIERTGVVESPEIGKLTWIYSPLFRQMNFKHEPSPKLETVKLITTTQFDEQTTPFLESMLDSMQWVAVGIVVGILWVEATK